MRKKILKGIGEADENDGVLILTDMFGGTPSNVALSFHEEHHVEVVTGMNLPMLVKLASLKDDKSLEELATFVKEYGQRNISVASQLLPEGNPG
jgi:PTS system mannose-specific IIA component